MKENMTIRLETQADYREVERLTREAFWNLYRPGCTEHYILHCYRSREDFIPELDLVLEKDGEIIGHVMYVRSEIQTDDGITIPTMTFGPISIAPEHQRKGYGTTLLRHSMDRAKALGAGALAITGAIEFYGKSGFVVASTRNIHYFAEPRNQEVPYFLIRELDDGYLDGIAGIFKDPEGYSIDEGEAEAFDALFPPKEKKKLPGQLV